MLTIGDEDDILKDVVEGIEIALNRTEHSDDDLDPIKVNKLAYLAIQDLELPITYGWYKYGPAPIFDIESARVTPKSESEVTAADEPRFLDPGKDFYSPLEYSYYFVKDCIYFERILQTPTKIFLLEFYEDFAPEPYGSVYEKNTQVQVLLDEIKDHPEWHDDASSIYRSLSHELNELKRELAEISHLAEVLEPYSEYSRLIKDVLAEATTQEDLSMAQQRFIGRVVDYYYGGVWNYVALLISKNTIHLSPGNNDTKLLNSIDADLQALRSSIDDELHALTDQSKKRGLAPGYEPRSTDDEKDNSSEGRSSTEGGEKRVEPWTKASSEAFLLRTQRKNDAGELE